MKSWLYDDYLAERAEWITLSCMERPRMKSWLIGGLFWGLVVAFVEWRRR